MPTYVYRREDGTTFEIEQRITAEALETCPTTGQPVKRLISGGTGLIFKGSGFYLTDYARKNGKKAKTEDSKPTDKSASASKKKDSSSEKSDAPSEKSSKPAASKSDD